MIEAVVESGAADCVAICRPLIREPNLIKRWSEGDTRPADCLSCRGCLKTDKDGKSDIRCRQVKEAERATA